MACLSFPSVNTASLNSLTGTASVLYEQSPLRLGHWDWASPEWCWNSPIQPKVMWLPRIHQDPGNDHKKSSEWFTPEPWPHYSWPQYKTVGLHWPWVVGGSRGVGNAWKGPRYPDSGKEEPLKVGCGGCLQILLLRGTLPLSPSSSRLPLIVNNIYWSSVAWQPGLLISSLTLTSCQVKEKDTF